MRAHSAAPQQREAGAHAPHRAHRADLEGRDPLLVGAAARSVAATPTSTGPDRVHERVHDAAPLLARSTANARSIDVGVAEVGLGWPAGWGCRAGSSDVSAASSASLPAGQDGDVGAVGGEALCGGEPHALGAAGDDDVRSANPRSMSYSSAIR